ncbi:MAG: lamin tail domain-containing protein [Bacteroidota bacterium]|nr:lamin tail domain-containing protein [Bacteroidota bacterium]
MKKFLQIFMISFTSFAFAQDCSDLFISEYIEGPAQDNGLEIYNPTLSIIDLGDYVIKRYSNGDQNASESWSLSGNINSGQAITIGNGQQDSVWVTSGAGYWSVPVTPSFYAACNLHCSGVYPTPFYFNGDDAITLEHINGNIIDIIGKVGQDPGAAWTDDASAGYTDANGGTWWTKRQTLVRKPTVKKGVSMNPLFFNPTLEWDSLPDGTYTQMGNHNCDCPVNSTSIENYQETFSVFPNPVNQGGSIFIKTKSNIRSIQIINILGSVLDDIVIDKQEAILSTYNLLKGIYLLNIEFENGDIINHRLVLE